MVKKCIDKLYLRKMSTPTNRSIRSNFAKKKPRSGLVQICCFSRSQELILDVCFRISLMSQDLWRPRLKYIQTFTSSRFDWVVLFVSNRSVCIGLWNGPPTSHLYVTRPSIHQACDLPTVIGVWKLDHNRWTFHQSSAFPPRIHKSHKNVPPRLPVVPSSWYN